MKAFSQTEVTQYAVKCPDHGKVYLSEEEYIRQLENPNCTWRCGCGGEAYWDDEHYEKWLDIVEHLQDLFFPPKALPPAYVSFSMAVGQRWRLEDLHNLPLGLCWLKEEGFDEWQRHMPSVCSIFIGVYHLTLLYCRIEGDFVTVAIHEVRNTLSRHELWTIAGRSLKQLLEEDSQQRVVMYKEGSAYRPVWI